jgi:hypothetical protein
MSPWTILTYHTSPIICHSLYALKSVRDVIQVLGERICDITTSFCRIAIFVTTSLIKNYVLFPHLSASYETRTAQQLSRLLLVFNYIEIYLCSSPRNIPLSDEHLVISAHANGGFFLMVLLMVHCDTIVQHKQNYSVSHFEILYCIS